MESLGLTIVGLKLSDILRKRLFRPIGHQVESHKRTLAEVTRVEIERAHVWLEEIGVKSRFCL